MNKEDVLTGYQFLYECLMFYFLTASLFRAPGFRPEDRIIPVDRLAALAGFPTGTAKTLLRY